MDKTIKQLIDSPSFPYILGAIGALYVANKVQSGVTSAVDNAFGWVDNKLAAAGDAIKPVVDIVSLPFEMGVTAGEKMGWIKPDPSFMGPPEPTLEQINTQYAKDPAPDNSSYVGGDQQGIFPWGMP